MKYHEELKYVFTENHLNFKRLFFPNTWIINLGMVVINSNILAKRRDLAKVDKIHQHNSHSNTYAIRGCWVLPVLSQFLLHAQIG